MRAFFLTFMLSSAGALLTSPLLQFSAPWCQPCRQMAPVVAQVEAAGHPVQKVDIDSDRATAAKFGVTAVPAFVAVKDGKEVDRHVGVATLARLTEMVAKVTAAAADTPDKHPTIVRVGVTEANGRGSFGSGTIIAAGNGEATVITAWHLFRDGSVPWAALHDGRRFKGRGLVFDKTQDLAVFVIDDPEVGCVGIADEPPAPDEWLTAYGFDGGASLANYRAFVGPFRRLVSFTPHGPSVSWDDSRDGTALVVGCCVRQGDSGGPILNAAGHLVATITGTRDGITVGPCLPRLKAVLAKLGCRPKRLPTPAPPPPTSKPPCCPPTPIPAPPATPPIGPIIVPPLVPPEPIPGPVGPAGKDGANGKDGKDGPPGPAPDTTAMSTAIIEQLKAAPITVQILDPKNNVLQSTEARLGGTLRFRLTPVQPK